MNLTDFFVKSFTKPLFKIEKIGFEKIDLSKPTIFMSNHVSEIDLVLLSSVLPKEVCFVTSKDIENTPFSKIANRKVINFDPNNPRDLVTVIKLIENGETVLVFPEARITRTNGLMKIHSAFSQIAIKTNAIIYPIGINGPEHSYYSYLEHKVPQKRYPKVRIALGNPFSIIQDENLSEKERKELANSLILNKLQEAKVKTLIKQNVNLFNELLEAQNLYDSGNPIAEDSEASLTYDKLLLNTYVLSNRLEKILKNEQNVGVLLPNALGTVVTLFSLFRIGKTPAMLNFSMSEQALLDSCETASLKIILTSRKFIKKGNLDNLIDFLNKRFTIIYLEDVKESITTSDKLKGVLNHKLKKRSNSKENELILFTSGSESKPKGVILTHDNLFANIQQARCVLDITNQDRLFNSLPMFHSFGLTAGTILPTLLGLNVFLFPSPLHYKDIPGLIYEHRSTLLFGTSTFLDGYGKFAESSDFSTLRYVVAGAEKLKDDVFKLYNEQFGIRILEGYGVTESSPVLSLNTPINYKKGSVGKMIPGIEYKLEEVEGIPQGGKLLVKGPNVMKGYLIHNQGFIPQDGWYDTGDVVDIDQFGFITIQSRLKRFAKIAGEMVSLNLLEQLAAQCFGHTDFYAVNIPDDKKGERIILFTTHENVDDKILKKFIKNEKHSSLLIPYKVVHIPEIPVLGSGKTNYIALSDVAKEIKKGWFN